MSMESESFLARFSREANLSPKATQVLNKSGARTPEAILSLLRAFPSLAKVTHWNVAELSNKAFQYGGANLQAVLSAGSKGPLSDKRRGGAAGFGARPPESARWQLGEKVPVEPEPASREAALAPGANPLSGPGVDVRGCLPWPARDQGQRGTCVAFAVTALREQLQCEEEGRSEDLSEQFLYWAVKTASSDPCPNKDGTWIEHAFEVLQNHGACLESLWPYARAPIPANISHAAPGAPSAAAIADASTHARKADVWKRTYGSTGHADAVFTELRRARRPVAVALPVFSDPTRPDTDNWDSDGAWLFGDVINPPETSVVSAGHAVCITGFRPDPGEPMGGYFVIRNSWSADWGVNLPAAGYHGPERGYGQVSAWYVDNFLWEYGQL